MKELQSKTAAKSKDKLNAILAQIAANDHLMAEVEAIVLGSKTREGRVLDIDFFDSWGPGSIVVTAWDADPADIIESVCGPLFQHFGRPWSMSTMSDIKAIFRAPIKNAAGNHVDLCVQVCSPVGCRFEEVQVTEKRMVCE